MSDFATSVGNDSFEYFSIGGGNIIQPAEPNAKGAKLRTWERPDGTTGEKWEYRFKDVTGLITGIEFKDSQYGENVLVEITNANLKKAKLQISLDSRYFQSFGSLFKNIDLSEEVVINSYEFTKDASKRLVGMSITQDGKKVKSYYYDTEKKVSINGINDVDEAKQKKMGKKYWGGFFDERAMFLKDEMLSVKIPDFLGDESNAQEATPEDVEDLFKTEA